MSAFSDLHPVGTKAQQAHDAKAFETKRKHARFNHECPPERLGRTLGKQDLWHLGSIRVISRPPSPPPASCPFDFPILSRTLFQVQAALDQGETNGLCIGLGLDRVHTGVLGLEPSQGPDSNVSSHGTSGSSDDAS